MVFRDTEAGRTRFWDAFSTLEPKKRYRHLLSLYRSLRETNYTQHVSRAISITYPHVLATTPHNLKDAPNDAILTPAGAFWVAIPQKPEDPPNTFTHIGLDQYDYFDFFRQDTRGRSTQGHLIHRYSPYIGDIQSWLPLKDPKTQENILTAIVWPIIHPHDINNLRRLLEHLG